MRSWLLILLCCALAGAQDPRSYYEDLIRRGVATGAAFASIDHGQVTEIQFFGKFHADSLWRAASTSKALTALAVTQLAERGQLDLSADVNLYLKTFKIPATKQHAITARHLLEHTSGLDDYFVDSAFLDSAGPPRLPDRLYEPGTVRLYTNMGYGVLGTLIQDVTGRRFEEYMRSEVLAPLGMKDSTFEQPLPEALRWRVVPTLKRTVLGFVHPAELIYHRASAGGGLTTSLADLVRFAQFIQKRGALPFGETGISGGRRYWYAGGDLGGYHTVILWFPETGRALVTMAASYSEMATWNLVPKVMGQWFGPETKLGPAASLDPAFRTEAARVAGLYRPVRYPHHDLGKTFLVTMDQTVRANADGSLQAGGERWVPVGNLRFRQESEERYLTFKNGFMNRESERIAWYESGRLAIAAYFGFIIYAVAVFFKCKPLRWVAGAVLIHSVWWLGAALIADPQRLILGLPCYLKSSLWFGTAVPLLWIYSAFTVRRIAHLLAVLLFALYLPFALYWQLIGVVR